MLAMLGSVAAQGGNAPIDIYNSGDLKTGLCGGWDLHHAYNSSSGYIYLRSSMDDSNTQEGGEARTKDSSKMKSLGRNVLEIDFKIISHKENDYKDITIQIRSAKGYQSKRLKGYSGSDIADGRHTLRLYVSDPLTDPPIEYIRISNQSIVNRVSVHRVTLIDGKTEV